MQATMEPADWMTFASGLSWIVGLILQIALIVVAVVRVRPKRSDAAAMLVLSAAVAIFTSCLGLSAPLLASRVDIDAFLRASAIGATISAALHALSFGLVIAAIVRLLELQPGPREF
jgi:hypothetical protein